MERRKRLLWLAVACGALALVGIAAVVMVFVWTPGASASPGSAVNLVSATDHGCSPDTFTGPDLDVVVRLDGEAIISAEASDDRNPVFAILVPVERTGTVEVTAREREPFGESVTCDLTPGSGTTASFAWDGALTERTLRGSGERSAEVRLVLGRPPAGVTGLKAHADGTSVRLTWTLPTPHPDSVQVLRGTSGSAAAVLDGDAASARFDGLCDGRDYRVRVVAQSGPWWVPVQVGFRTDNLPPAAPRILSARVQPGAGAEPLRVEWEMASPHDIARYEVHAGTGGFSPHGNTLQKSFEPEHGTRQSGFVPEGGSTVRVVAVDAGGLSSASEPFHVGAAPAEPTPGLRACDQSTDPLSRAHDVDTPLPLLVPLAAVAVAARSGRRLLAPRP